MVVSPYCCDQHHTIYTTLALPCNTPLQHPPNKQTKRKKEKKKKKLNYTHRYTNTTTMSPPEHTPQSPADLASWLESKYSVTPNGFLPSAEPLAVLPDAYYQPWETLASSLPKLLQTNSFRAHVDAELPVLSTSRLQAEQEWRRAYLILTFATHAYIWGGDKPSEHLPPQITVPLLDISRHLDLPPAATYAATNLWNFRTTAEGAPFSDLDAIESLITFTGTPDESWFYAVSVALECEGGNVIPAMISAMNAIPNNDLAACRQNIAALHKLMASIRRVGDILDRMHERCGPDVFYHAIRPFLAGSKNMADAGLPRGVLYDQGDGQGDWLGLRGGSNGQSSLIQFFDIVLGVEHKATENQNSDLKKREDQELPFHEEVRAYMPGPHRRFLEYVRSLPSIRDFALQPMETDEATGEQEDEEDHELMAERGLLRSTFTRATRVLAGLRNKHLQIVARYIILPSRRQQQQVRSGLGQQPGQRNIGLAGVAWREPPQNPVAVPNNDVDGAANGGGAGGGERKRRMSETQLTGTGGTALMPFLKQVRDETVRAGRPDEVAIEA